MTVELFRIIRVGTLQDIRDLILTIQNRQSEVILEINPVTQECVRYVFRADSTAADDNVNVLKPAVDAKCGQGGGRWLKCLVATAPVVAATPHFDPFTDPFGIGVL